MNLVLIVIDSLRRDWYPLGDVARPASPAAPTLLRLARSGAAFDQAIAQGHATWTTMPAILTGCYPSTYGGFERLTAERPRLASELQALGYRTGAFAPNPYLTRARGYGIGFDHFDECLPVRGTWAARGGRRQATWMRAVNRLLGRWGIGIECPPYLDARSVTDRAIRWLTRDASPRPFFLWIQYMDVHMPYHLQRCALLLPGGRGQRPYGYGFWARCVRQGAELDEREMLLLQELYGQGLAFVDGQIGRLLAALRGSGLYEQTTFVVTADHGEEFGEHGLYGHQSHLYEESIHVPLVVASAEGGPLRVGSQVRHLDLAPTLIEMAGGTPPPTMQGASLGPLLRGQAQDQDRPAISQTHPGQNWQVSLRRPPWKLLWRVDPETGQGYGAELYHLADDPGERANLAARHPERVHTMQDELRAHIDRLDLARSGYGEAAGGEIDPGVRERLQALGYLGDA